jgi:hypothetical protein
LGVIEPALPQLQKQFTGNPGPVDDFPYINVSHVR